MVLIVQAHEGHPQQRAVLQVERGARGIFAELLRAGFAFGAGHVAEVNDVQIERCVCIYPLESLAIAFIEACTQGFVALDQVLEAGAHGAWVQRSAQTQGAGNGVGAALRVELPSDPQAVLRQRLRQGFAA
ncbi:hypothetical protein PFUM301598_07310 [Pseudomonas fluorescens]